jgi:hypothetical protein
MRRCTCVCPCIGVNVHTDAAASAQCTVLRSGGFKVLSRRDSPLHLAAKEGRGYNVVMLVAGGADVTARNNDG